jgi:hypothetical protein
LDQATLKDWLDGYKRAWEQTDATAAGNLFSENATYQEKPFDEPMRGREGVVNYWNQVAVGKQKNIDFGYKILGISGNTGFAEWWVDFDLVSADVHVRLAGIFVLEFDGSGLCTSLREWWHVDAG